MYIEFLIYIVWRIRECCVFFDIVKLRLNFVNYILLVRYLLV